MGMIRIDGDALNKYYCASCGKETRKDLIIVHITMPFPDPKDFANWHPKKHFFCSYECSHRWKNEKKNKNIEK